MHNPLTKPEIDYITECVKNGFCADEIINWLISDLDQDKDEKICQVVNLVNDISNKTE